MTYLADCGGPCSEFSGSTGNVWVKIDQSGYDAAETVPWASKRLPENNSTYTVTLPSTIAPGEYLLRWDTREHRWISSKPLTYDTPMSRHEILGLQRTNTNGSLAQFYPNCHQVTVTGSGTTALPEGIALPGAYQPDDTTSVWLQLKTVPDNTLGVNANFLVKDFPGVPRRVR